MSEALLRNGDKMDARKQPDNTYNVSLRLVVDSGKDVFVGNVSNPDIWARRIRYIADNPPEPDLVIERDLLIEHKAAIDARIAEIDGILNG